MKKLYPAEKEIKLKFQSLPEYLKSSLEGIKLEEIENTGKIINYTNGASFSLIENSLTLENEEKFEGIFNKEKCQLKRGKYFWPDGQEYNGEFDEQNRFFTKEGELAKLIFSNGDIFEGEFKEGKIGLGTFKTEGKILRANFTGGKVNGTINLNDSIEGIKFKGVLSRGKKQGYCETEVKIKDKIFSIKGEYLDGVKNGPFIIREISPNYDNLCIKGKYKEGERHGFFDIIDKEKGINITHEYISFLQNKLINEYNQKYKENINGKEVNISITCRDNPMTQLMDLVRIRFSYLLTLDLTKANINSISFLDTEESTLFSLQKLILSYNNISDLKPLVNVNYKKLITLKINDNKVKKIDCVESFNFKELQELDLSCNPINSIEGIEKWQFPNLFSLSLYRTNISDIYPIYKANFPNLTQLDLVFTKIQDYYLPYFKYCKNLKRVMLDKHY